MTNTLTGVAAAYADSVPLFVVATQVPSVHYGRDGHQQADGSVQSIDQLAMFETCSSVRFRPPNAERAVALTRVALTSARGRRSVGVVDYPVDIFLHDVIFEDLEPARYRATSSPVDSTKIKEVASLLRSAKRPVIVMGRRSSHRGLGPDLLRLVDAIDVPVVASDQAKGIISEDHPLYLGNLGFAGHDSAAEYMRSSDRD